MRGFPNGASFGWEEGTSTTFHTIHALCIASMICVQAHGITPRLTEKNSGSFLLRPTCASAALAPWRLSLNTDDYSICFHSLLRACHKYAQNAQPRASPFGSTGYRAARVARLQDGMRRATATRPWSLKDLHHHHAVCCRPFMTLAVGYTIKRISSFITYLYSYIQSCLSELHHICRDRAMKQWYVVLITPYLASASP